MDTLAVRFHYGGEFYFDGKRMHYLGGSERLSYIDRDLISLPEIVGHLKDHGVVGDDVLLHWLCPGKNLDDGLTVLHDDNVCLTMSQCVQGSEIADVFVESMAMQLEANTGGDMSEGVGNEMTGHMGGKQLIDIDACSSDEVEFIGENLLTPIQVAPVKIEQCQQIQLFTKDEEEKESLQMMFSCFDLILNSMPLS